MQDYIIRTKLIISATDYHPPKQVKSIPGFEKQWKKGEIIHEGRNRKYLDNGFSLILLEETSIPEWTDVLINRLRQIMPRLHNILNLSVSPTPLISIYIDTNGERYPPLYFSKQLMCLLHELGAEMDIDVITSL